MISVSNYTLVVFIYLLFFDSSRRMCEGAEHIKFEAKFTQYDVFASTEYHKFLPPPASNTWYYTRLKAETKLSIGSKTDRTEEILLVTLEDSSGGVGIHKAYILAKPRMDAFDKRFQALEVFNNATRNIDYAIPTNFVSKIVHSSPEHATFEFQNLTGSSFPELVVQLWLAGGSYSPLYVAVILCQNLEMKIGLRVQGGLRNISLGYKDLDADGHLELLVPEEINVMGPHVSCPDWITCYQWKDSRFIQANHLFYSKDVVIKSNLHERYNDVLLGTSGIDYCEEYEYYLGLLYFYQESYPKAAWYLQRVVARAKDKDYSKYATSVLNDVKLKNKNDR